ncbi:hypothetical protein V5P93_004616 [Actinokineospora auranticolor]|uniref:Uncharacterized protein n=1 Tax=Actinokineospora auranticolor TaxID=155976 RepID=A0A2S6GT32_9PSEU|nr:hypothetical protein [Actinokineospora auranticolor]PPK68281.1 hypothetical protein CLV40_1054 [Actinokineospora auranticolor]
MPLYEETVASQWCAPGERLLVLLGPREGNIASRIGGQPRFPHPPADDVPELVPIKDDWPELSDFAVRLPDDEWVDEPSLAWFAEAPTAGHDAVVAAGYLAAGNGQVGLAITDRRVAVLFPERLLVTEQLRRKGSAPKKPGLLGRAAKAFDNWLDTTAEWRVDDAVISFWETDRVPQWDTALVGRGAPFTWLVRVRFADGSRLSARAGNHDHLAG